MAKTKSSLLNMVLVLTLITALVGAIMGSVYQITLEPIARATAQAQEEAIKQVAPQYDNNPIAESDTVQIEGSEIVVFPASMEGLPTGAAVKASSKNGFNGEIVIIVGFELDGKIRDYRVLSHGETPGLGAKMAQWFREAKGKQSHSIERRRRHRCHYRIHHYFSRISRSSKNGLCRLYATTHRCHIWQ